MIASLAQVLEHVMNMTCVNDAEKQELQLMLRSLEEAISSSE